MLVGIHHIVSLKHEQSHNNHYYEAIFLQMSEHSRQTFARSFPVNIKYHNTRMNRHNDYMPLPSTLGL